MRFVLIIVLAVVLSLGLTYLVHQPSVHNQLVSWSQQASRTVAQKIGAAPPSEGHARGLDDGDESGLELDAMFWLEQSLNLVYVFLGVALTEVVRAFDRRTYGS
jgi:hypothetical protein